MSYSTYTQQAPYNKQLQRTVMDKVPEAKRGHAAAEQRLRERYKAALVCRA
jgi:hypothetical protein